jgi:hypothetical protein
VPVPDEALLLKGSDQEAVMPAPPSVTVRVAGKRGATTRNARVQTEEEEDGADVQMAALVRGELEALHSWLGAGSQALGAAAGDDAELLLQERGWATGAEVPEGGDEGGPQSTKGDGSYGGQSTYEGVAREAEATVQAASVAVTANDNERSIVGVGADGGGAGSLARMEEALHLVQSMTTMRVAPNGTM